MEHDVRKLLEAYHPGQQEYHQAVLEVFSDVADYYADHSDLREAAVLERLIEPDRLIGFRVSWEDDQGRMQVNRGWRVQFHNDLGPYKGGLRFHPSVNPSVLMFLGFEQCFKNALTGLPLGGAKGGSDFNPKNRSINEVRRFCASFMEELYPYIGPETDIPAGDIGVGEREIGFLFGHYLKLTRRFDGVITGKDPNYGGSFGRMEATGYGLISFLEEMMKNHDEELEGQRVLISGAGNVALHAAERALEKKAQVLSLSDSKGALFFKNGLTPESLQEIMDLKIQQRGQLRDYQGSIEYSYAEGATPWSIPADVALPCATQNELTEKDLARLCDQGLRFIAEGANMPLTKEAVALALEKKLIYGPGKAANAGGVAVSNFERSQNSSYLPWSKQEVENCLDGLMKDIHSRCVQNIQRKDGVYNYKKGANLHSFIKIAHTMVAFGVK